MPGGVSVERCSGNLDETRLNAFLLIATHRARKKRDGGVDLTKGFFCALVMMVVHCSFFGNDLVIVWTVEKTFIYMSSILDKINWQWFEIKSVRCCLSQTPKTLR